MGSMFEEEEYFIPPLSRYSYTFPDPRNASDEGLLAYGGDLSSSRLLTAYRNGIFPWYNEGDPILWWSPDPRLLLYPGKFKVRKSFRRVLRILPEMQEAYLRLHEEGFAHSVEVYREGKLAGGLYGLAMGKAFFGESMFSLASDASKIAFKALSDVLGAKGYDFIDCQMKTDHMVGLGAEVVERNRYLDELKEALEKPSDLGSWQHFSWSYPYNKEEEW